MKTLIVNLFVIVIFTTSCTTPKYLPELDNYWKGAHGAYIKITKNNHSVVKGELLHVDTDKLFILKTDHNNSYIVIVKSRDIKRYYLKYIKAPQYGWNIPFYTLLSLTHGIYAVFTIPLNLITTTTIAVSENCKYTYNNKTLAYKKLRMYARFPQGIPKNIKLNRIK